MTKPMTLVVKGTFTATEIRRVVELVAEIESGRPEENFEIYLNDPQAISEAKGCVAKMLNRPLRPGYERIVTTMHYRDEGES